MLAALGSAALFGVATPIAKVILGTGVSPWLLAGLLYTGSGLGMTAYRVLTNRPRTQIPVEQRTRLVATITIGGLLGPVLLMLGLARTPATTASLLLTTEGVLTAVLAWTVFREHVAAQLVAGMALITGGAILLAGGGTLTLTWPALAIVAACACWAIDNNLTRDLHNLDSTWLAAAKGLIAGPTNLTLALATGAQLPSLPTITVAALLGVASYGLSIVLFIGALRGLGTARTGAYFGLAPFIGAAAALTLGEPLTPALGTAAVLMAIGTYLHLREHHRHDHSHPAEQHSHPHRHDDGHHQHSHSPDPGRSVHNHAHEHRPVTHSHPHYPDTHHRHDHHGGPEPSTSA